MENESAFDALIAAKKNKQVENNSMMSFMPIMKNKILVPFEFETLNDYTGKLYGYIQKDTGVHIIIGWEGNKPDIALKTYEIGFIKERHNEINCIEIKHGEILGCREQNGIINYYYRNAESCQTITLQKEIYSLTQDLFLRNTGLLESSKMKEKTVLIVGCGSVGGTLALQLARSGVGHFVLVDTDTIEIHNICRHQCNLTDIGRFKTFALRDRIIAINPSAIIKCFNNIIQNVTSNDLDNLLNDQSVIVGCGDNRLSDAYSCEEAYIRNIPFISIGFWTNAFVCEIVTCIPQRGDTCYRCALQGPIEKSIEIANNNRRYVRPGEQEKIIFEPGISIDIEFGTSIGSKIVIDALNFNDSSYVPKVLHSLTQYTLICNTNNVEINNDNEETRKAAETLKTDLSMFSNPLQVVRNINFEKGDCKYCNHI